MLLRRADLDKLAFGFRGHIHHRDRGRNRALFEAEVAPDALFSDDVIDLLVFPFNGVHRASLLTHITADAGVIDLGDLPFGKVVADGIGWTDGDTKTAVRALIVVHDGQVFFQAERIIGAGLNANVASDAPDVTDFLNH